MTYTDVSDSPALSDLLLHLLILNLVFFKHTLYPSYSLFVCLISCTRMLAFFPRGFVDPTNTIDECFLAHGQNS